MSARISSFPKSELQLITTAQCPGWLGGNSTWVLNWPSASVLPPPRVPAFLKLEISRMATSAPGTGLWLAHSRARTLNANGRPKYNALMKADLKHPIEKVGAQLRARMPWLESAKA